MCGVIQAELLFDLSPISEVGQLPRVVPEAAELQICGERLDRRREQDWRELLLSSELVAACSPGAASALSLLGFGTHRRRHLG